MFLKEIRLYDVEHLLQLTEDEDTVLRERPRRAGLGVDEFALRALTDRC